MRCRICGRELKDPESIKQRIGPVCRKKYGDKAEEAIQKRLDEMANKLDEKIRDAFKTALELYQKRQEKVLEGKI